MSSTRDSDLVLESTLHSEIQHFYARQMQLLDAGRTDEWADTFTQDGVFAANGRTAATGRPAIRKSAAQTAAQLAEKGVQVRHWLGMADVRPKPDGTLHVSCYALILNTAQGGSPAVHLSTTCEDVLVRAEDGGWQVSVRQVQRDDLR